MRGDAVEFAAEGSSSTFESIHCQIASTRTETREKEFHLLNLVHLPISLSHVSSLSSHSYSRVPPNTLHYSPFLLHVDSVEMMDP